MVAQPCGVSTSFLTSANLLMLQSVPSPKSVLNVLNSNATSIDPWHTPLVSGLQLDFVSLTTTLAAQYLNQLSVPGQVIP